MKVKDLIKLLSDCEPEATIVVSHGDHCYRRIAYINQAGAMQYADGRLSEYHGEEITKGNRVVPVVVLE